MSCPHTGRLEARVQGKLCRFNGDVWNCPDDAKLEARLNRAMDYVTKHHYDIATIARCVFRRLRMQSEAEIIFAEGDAWKKPLPPGAID